MQLLSLMCNACFFFFQAEDGIRDIGVTGVQTCALPICQTQPATLGQRDWNVNVLDQNRIVMSPTQAGLDKALDDAMNTAREVVYNRVDPEGTKEVTVIRQGGERILVQVPGLQDPEGLKALIGKTARLEFKLVDLNAP